LRRIVQIGPHLVQPSRARPMPITLKISANRVNMVDPLAAPYHSAAS
jgi:hypothetical protein